jgi:hypothetical protein
MIKILYSILVDLEMLEKTIHVRLVFYNVLTEKRKLIECVRVDGAGDEGPSHEEVQFVWTTRHLTGPTIATLITSRSSGSSYLNRVELQNGCLALAHANLFIPSTLGGSCVDCSTGKIDRDKYIHNMNLATDVYISRVDQAPCGNTVIHLFKGPNSQKQQVERKYLLQFLKGSKQQKSLLRSSHPELYSYFEQIWAIRNRHMVKNLPSQYIFFLYCCLERDCNHPICKSDVYNTLPTWYKDGPSIAYLPIPVPDPSYPWGSTDCRKCKQPFCTGHYLSPSDAAIELSALPMIKPPSQVIREAFESTCGQYPPSDNFCHEIAQQTLLSVEEVKQWIEHLYTIKQNRIRGAAKAAETKRTKVQESNLDEHEASGFLSSSHGYFCGPCKSPYQQFICYN